MLNTIKLLAGLFALATLVIAQAPIASGKYLVFSQPSNPAQTELFWDVAGGNTIPPVLGVTNIIAQFLDQLPPSETNQQWMANFVVGLGGSSGLYIFNSVLGPTVFFGLNDAGGAVVSATPTAFNVTAQPQFGRGLVTIQVTNSNLALTSNNALTEQITIQPLAVGNFLQLWNFFRIGS